MENPIVYGMFMGFSHGKLDFSMGFSMDFTGCYWMFLMDVYGFFPR